MAVSVATFRKMALAIPDVSEAPHFDSEAFLTKGKIFATLNEGTGRVVVKLLLEQQEIMTTAEPDIFQRVPNYWGAKGWTWVHLKHADAKTVQSALALSVGNINQPRRGARKKK